LPMKKRFSADGEITISVFHLRTTARIWRSY
jgi:hypothetical protein